PRPQTKSASCLAQSEVLPHLSIGLIQLSSKRTLLPSTLSLKSRSFVPLQQLLLLSPSPLWRSKIRLANQLEMAHEPVEQVGSRWLCKRWNARRSRRRPEMEVREENDLGLVEDI
ncbi:hypothetical protein TorRG33x02_341350, partial [Trema orientale]